MRGPKYGLLVMVSLSMSLLLLVPHPVLGAAPLAYIGPGPGMELIPSFFSLLIWMALAFGAVLLWPVHALLRLLRRGWTQVREAAGKPVHDAGFVTDGK